MPAFRLGVETLDKDDEDVFALDFCLVDATELDLSRCSFGTKSPEFLTKGFGYLKPCVTVIDLSRNSLHLYTKEALKQMFKALPESVLNINISFNGLGRSFSNVDLLEIISSMPCVKEVTLIDTTLTSDRRQLLSAADTGKTIITSEGHNVLFFSPAPGPFDASACSEDPQPYEP